MPEIFMSFTCYEPVSVLPAFLQPPDLEQLAIQGSKNILSLASTFYTTSCIIFQNWHEQYILETFYIIFTVAKLNLCFRLGYFRIFLDFCPLDALPVGGGKDIHFPQFHY